LQAKEPVRVLVTGAAGQIAYSLVFAIARGDMFGNDQPVILHLLDIPPMMEALKGVVMEIEDTASHLVRGRRPSLSTLDARAHSLSSFFKPLRDCRHGRSRGGLHEHQLRHLGRRHAEERGHGEKGPAQGQLRHLQGAGQGSQRLCP